MCGKINAGKQAQVTDDFMVVARIESLIAKQGLEDAVGRAAACLEAGADGIMIHSNGEDGEAIKEFCEAYTALGAGVPLISVPTSYNHFYEHELADLGFGVVIYANHLLRSAYPAMENTAQMILRHKRSREVDAH
jgi:2-methylisocitrate lyase-like PEP mutase family enzyme